MVEQLRQLIGRYIAVEINYVEFRNEFVRFMASSDEDQIVERVYNFIESGCSAFEHQFINELMLRLRLQQLLPPVFAAQNPNVLVQSNLVVYMPSMVRFASSPAGNINIGVPSIPSLGANQFLFDELELVEEA